MLLDRAGRPQVGGDLGMDRIPRPTDLRMQVAPQRREGLVQHLVAAMFLDVAAQADGFQQSLVGDRAALAGAW